LEDYYQYSDECIKSLVYTIDDYAYFQNNQTLTEAYKLGLDNPAMNFTKALAGNFSRAPVQCYQFGLSWWNGLLKKYAQFNNNIADYLIGWLFAQMGNALKYKVIFDDITKDLDNQYYPDIAYQIGKMIRLMFDFEPIEEGSY